MQAAVTPLVGQPGGLAGQDALSAEVIRAKAAEAANASTAFVNALIFG